MRTLFRDPLLNPNATSCIKRLDKLAPRLPATGAIGARRIPSLILVRPAVLGIFLYAARQIVRVPVDTTPIKERIDLLELIGRDTRLKRVASTRGGEYAGACRRLGASPSELGGRVRTKSTPAVATTPKLHQVSAPSVAAELEPTDVWRARGLGFVAECEAALWSPAGERARAYLHRRGLHDQTLRSWRVGFHPIERRYEPAERWGLPAQTGDGRQALTWLPRGVVLPWLADNKL